MAQVKDLRSRRLERAGIERILTIIGEAATIGWGERLPAQPRVGKSVILMGG
ncbi:MAG: hypothetical protein LLF90_00665 [Methanomicrobiaceae archaeon]|nr:hypothetical protein [Methanomicrobiaceae archaeon]